MRKETKILIIALGVIGSVASIYSLFQGGGNGDNISTSGNNNTIVKAGGNVSVTVNQLKEKGVTTPEGEYFGSIEQLVALAEKGDAKAQNYLGVACGNNIKDPMAAKKSSTRRQFKAIQRHIQSCQYVQNWERWRTRL